MKAAIGKNKKLALNAFATEIRRRFGNKILGLYLFGSTAKGTAVRGSDIDVLIVYTGLEERTLLEAISEISFDIALSRGESIEATLMTKEEYERALGSSPFLWEVLTFGRPIFTKLRASQWKLNFKDYLSLAGEYLGYAKGALKRGEIRLAIDAGYNAVELLIKALIVSTRNPLAPSHGGLVTQFGKLFVLTGEIGPEVGKGLKLALELRAKARYRPEAKLSRGDAKFVIDLAEKVLDIARKRLVKNPPQNMPADLMKIIKGAPPGQAPRKSG
jgi:predicted nucleotidyltransferase/uncharacterized protein (UPF0332 family)